MSRRTRILIILGLAVGLMVILLVWRTTRETDFAPYSSPLSPTAPPAPLALSPLSLPTATSLESPLPGPSTATPPINSATLEAIRAVRPTAPPPSPSGIRLPYVSPETWRGWALRILAAAGVLAYIGLRLRKNQ